MSKPKVMILLTCEDGHQVEVFPEKVIRKLGSGYPGDPEVVYVKWECPRCENPKVNHVDIM